MTTLLAIFILLHADRIVYFGEFLCVRTLCDVYYKEHIISVQTWTHLRGCGGWR